VRHVKRQIVAFNGRVRENIDMSFCLASALGMIVGKRTEAEPSMYIDN
jgi:hypothetical protein